MRRRRNRIALSVVAVAVVPLDLDLDVLVEPWYLKNRLVITKDVRLVRVRSLALRRSALLVETEESVTCGVSRVQIRDARVVSRRYPVNCHVHSAVHDELCKRESECHRLFF